MPLLNRPGIQMPTLISEQKCSETGAPSTSAPIARKGLSSTAKARIIFYAKISIAILALILVGQALSFSDIRQAFANASVPHLIAGVALLVPNLLIQASKWHYLLRLANASIPFRSAYKSLVAGFPLGFVTPGRLGEVGRALFIKEISPMRTLRLVALDKITNLLVTLTVGLLALLTFRVVPLSSVLATAAAALLGLTILALGLIVFSRTSRTCIMATFRLNSFQRGQAAVSLFFSLAFYSVFTVQFMLFIMAFEKLPFLENGRAVASVFLVKTLLPFSFGDLGIREGAAVFFFSKLNYPATSAFSAASFLFATNVVLPALIGLPTILKTRKKSPWPIPKTPNGATARNS